MTRILPHLVESLSFEEFEADTCKQTGGIECFELGACPGFQRRLRYSCCHMQRLEARGGIEPPSKGFADLCLTTWLPRRTFFSLPNRRTRILTLIL